MAILLGDGSQTITVEPPKDDIPLVPQTEAARALMGLPPFITLDDLKPQTPPAPAAVTQTPSPTPHPIGRHPAIIPKTPSSGVVGAASGSAGVAGAADATAATLQKQTVVLSAEDAKAAEHKQNLADAKALKEKNPELFHNWTVDDLVKAKEGDKDTPGKSFKEIEDHARIIPRAKWVDIKDKGGLQEYTHKGLIPVKDDTRRLQEAMQMAGIKVDNDGKFGPKTSAALEELRQITGVQGKPGVVNAEDLSKLNAIAKEKMAAAGIPPHKYTDVDLKDMAEKGQYLDGPTPVKDAVPPQPLKLPDGAEPIPRAQPLPQPPIITVEAHPHVKDEAGLDKVKADLAAALKNPDQLHGTGGKEHSATRELIA